MYNGWNFLDAPGPPRNELRRDSEEEIADPVTLLEQVRTLIVEVLRGFPEAHRAVIERLTRMVPPLPLPQRGVT